MNVVVAKQALKFRTGEKVKIALAPFRAPRGTFAGGGLHFVVFIREMDYKLGNSGFQMIESVPVEIIPFFGRETRFHGNNTLDDDVIWTNCLFQKGKLVQMTSSSSVLLPWNLVSR